MATYSLAVLGARADQSQGVENVTLPDSDARQGSQQQAMRNGTQMLCKGPDGGFRLYTLDAERSTPDRPILRAVGP